jgi:hypothetical protein
MPGKHKPVMKGKGFGGKRLWSPVAEIYQSFSEETGVRHKTPVR